MIRSVAPDGLVHMHVQRHRGLLRYIADYPGSHFAIAVVALPEVIADRFTIRSVIAIYPDQDDPRCLLMAREAIAIHFRHQAASAAGGQPLYVGVGPTATYQPNLASNTDTVNNHLTIGLLRHNTDGNQASLRVNSAAAGTVTQTSAASFVTLSDGAWYKLTAQLAYGGAGYAVSVSLDATDELGFVTNALLTHTRTGISVPALAADPSVHAFFGGQGSAAQRGIQTVDNFLLETL